MPPITKEEVKQALANCEKLRANLADMFPVLQGIDEHNVTNDNDSLLLLILYAKQCYERSCRIKDRKSYGAKKKDADSHLFSRTPQPSMREA